MKIQCVSVVDRRGNRHDHFLTVGKTYAVHTLSASRDRGVEVRVLTDIGTHALGLYPIEMFDIVDGSLSPRWTVGADDKGRVELAPAEWVDTLLLEGSIEDGIEGLTGEQIRREIDLQEHEE